MVTVVIEGVWPFLNFNLSCNVSSISNESFADAHSSNITRLTLPMPMACQEHLKEKIKIVSI
jgi:hypothetical protein